MKINKSLLLFLLVYVGIVDRSFCQTWKVNPGSSKIEFKIKNAGLNVDGSFSGFEATIIFNPDDPSNSVIQGTIQTNTLGTGVKMRDNHLKGEDYFHVSSYARITFSSKKIISKGNGNYVMTGDLKIKDKIKEVSIPFSFQQNGKSGTFKGSLTLDRRDYGVGSSSWTLSDDVSIILTLVTEKTT